MPKRGKYSSELKKGALSLAPVRPVSVVPRKVGTGANLLSRWRREIDSQGQQAFSGSGHAPDEEVAQLKREPARVKKEWDFLREAATFFARGST